jgi:hypothetical protein
LHRRHAKPDTAPDVWPDPESWSMPILIPKEERKSQQQNDLLRRERVEKAIAETPMPSDDEINKMVADYMAVMECDRATALERLGFEPEDDPQSRSKAEARRANIEELAGSGNEDLV